jgi:hypothetical protein
MIVRLSPDQSVHGGNGVDARPIESRIEKQE